MHEGRDVAAELAISRTRLDEMNVCCSDGVRKIVSTPSVRCLFIVASWNSYSKSDTARSPRTIALSPLSRAKSTVRPCNR